MVCMVVPKILNVELPSNPVFPLLGINLREVKAGARTNICIPMFTAASFIIAKSCKQPTHPLIGEWTHKMWYKHIIYYYSAFKTNDIT